MINTNINIQMSSDISYKFLHFVLNETLINRNRILNILQRSDIIHSEKVIIIADLIRQIKYENYKHEHSKLYILASIATSHLS